MNQTGTTKQSMPAVVAEEAPPTLTGEEATMGGRILLGIEQLKKTCGTIADQVGSLELTVGTAVADASHAKATADAALALGKSEQAAKDARIIFWEGRWNDLGVRLGKVDRRIDGLDQRLASASLDATEHVLLDAAAHGKHAVKDKAHDAQIKALSRGRRQAGAVALLSSPFAIYAFEALKNWGRLKGWW